LRREDLGVLGASLRRTRTAQEMILLRGKEIRRRLRVLKVANVYVRRKTRDLEASEGSASVVVRDSGWNIRERNHAWGQEDRGARLMGERSSREYSGNRGSVGPGSTRGMSSGLTMFENIGVYRSSGSGGS